MHSYCTHCTHYALHTVLIQVSAFEAASKFQKQQREHEHEEQQAEEARKNGGADTASGGGAGGVEGDSAGGAVEEAPVVEEGPDTMLVGARPGEELADTARRLCLPEVVLEGSQWLRREQAERVRDSSTSAVPPPPSHTFHSLSPLTTHSLLIHNKQQTNTHKHKQLCENNSTHAQHLHPLFINR
jgi:hypothetical protein